MEPHVSDCIHCDIHDLLDAELAGDEADLGEIVAKVTEVLADLVLLAAPDERAALLSSVIANLGQFMLDKGSRVEETGEFMPSQH